MQIQNREAAIKAARIPTWLKIKLLRLHAGDRSEVGSYLDLGYHLGRHHLDSFIEDESTLLDVHEDEVESRPSHVLRRIFASEDHPHAEFVDLIPLEKRRNFLLGLLAGFDHEEGQDEYWLSRAA